MINPLTKRWSEMDDNMRASGINLMWTGSNDFGWNIGGFMAGAQGAIVTGPIKGMVHVPFKGIWHEPAYGPPRFERTVDERREISTRITLMSDSTYGWFNTETKWWDGMNGNVPGCWSIFTRAKGQHYLPMQLLEAVQTQLDDDPTSYGNNMQEWDILLGADGDPRWQVPDVRPKPWLNRFDRTTTVKRDEGLLAPTITVGVGTIKVAHRGTRPEWPIITLTAPKSGSTPARWWISNGSTGDMVRVPPLYAGEHVLIDTDPSHRIAISAIEPADNWVKQIIRNAELMQWLFGEYGESGETILERFHGQGFSNPIAPGTVGAITVFCDTENMRASVRLPQRFERAIS